MRKSIELTPGGKELKISFPYDERLLPVVRGFPGRRFDREQRAWFCPVSEVVEVVNRLREHQFVLDAGAQELFAESGGERAPAPDEAPSSWSISELNRRVHEALFAAFPREIWVVGEITGYDRSRHRAHVWFELAEKQGDEAQAEIRSRVSAVLFGRTRSKIERVVKECSDPFELRDGIEVRVLVRVDLYEVARRLPGRSSRTSTRVHTLGQAGPDTGPRSWPSWRSAACASPATCELPWADAAAPRRRSSRQRGLRRLQRLPQRADSARASRSTSRPWRHSTMQGQDPGAAT